jgi:hypothetical protein
MTERWINERTDMVTVTPLPPGEGGHGYHVQLHTTRTDIGSDYKRRTYHSDIIDAAKRAAWLMEDLAGGNSWSRVSTLHQDEPVPVVLLPVPDSTEVHTHLEGPVCSYWYGGPARPEDPDDPGACAHDSCMAIIHTPCWVCDLAACEPVTRMVPSAADPDPTCPHDGSAVRYVADYGAPGCGQAWECARGHSWAKVGGEFYDPNEQAHILTIEDVI